LTACPLPSYFLRPKALAEARQALILVFKIIMGFLVKLAGSVNVINICQLAIRLLLWMTAC